MITVCQMLAMIEGSNSRKGRQGLKKIILFAAVGVALFGAGVVVGLYLPIKHPNPGALQGAHREGVAVVPNSLSESPSLELGDLVLLLMPKSGERIDWDYRTDSAITWQTAGVTQETGDNNGASRAGAVRVNVMGRIATVLKQRKIELAWGVAYWTSRPAKFGPSEIKIEPGTEEPCFGTGFDGCEFEPLHSLAHAGIDALEACDIQQASDKTRVYLLTSPQRRPVTLIWYTSGGSGGASSWLSLEVEDRYNPELACAKLRAGEVINGSEAGT